MTPTSPHRVLVIDDDDGIRTVLVRTLERHGFASRAASDGHEGLAAAKEFRPAVIFCDVRLPSCDGPTVLAAVRADPSLEATQFVFMTGDVSGTSQRDGMELGADDYLAKPFTADEFLRAVKARLRRVELQRKADHQALERLRETVTRRLPHELFTPLTGILGMADVLLDEMGPATPTETREMVADIRLSAERLHHTLKNYLTILEVMEQRSGEIPAGGGTVGEGVAVVVRETATAAARRFNRVADLLVECAVRAIPLDPAALASVVGELVDNAFRYSPPGSIVEVKAVEREGGVVLSVRDQGRGMTAEQVEQIGAFRQFDRTKFEQQGLGLGLTLTQHVIERHGGNFRLESELARGTTVSATWERLPEVGTDGAR
jgi:two-component system, sensor histidine kinase and response regulator